MHKCRRLESGSPQRLASGGQRPPGPRRRATGEPLSLQRCSIWLERPKTCTLNLRLGIRGPNLEVAPIPNPVTCAGIFADGDCLERRPKSRLPGTREGVERDEYRERRRDYYLPQSVQDQLSGI